MGQNIKVKLYKDSAKRTVDMEKHMIWRNIHGSLRKRWCLYLELPSGTKTMYVEAPCQWRIGNQEIIFFKLNTTTYLTNTEL